MQDIKELTREFEECRNILTALGDENRQHLILEMMQMGKCNGVRVGEITQRSHLSRPAVSHHLKILKEAGIVNMRREGTRNYYYFDENSRVFESLLKMIGHANDIIKELPDRSAIND